MSVGSYQKVYCSEIINIAFIVNTETPITKLAYLGNIEGFGIVFMEAAACGKPVIAGQSGGAPDALVDGETGFLIPDNNVDLLEKKLSLLLENEETRTKMGNAGLTRARQEFNWANIAVRYASEMGLADQ